MSSQPKRDHLSDNIPAVGGPGSQQTDVRHLDQTAVARRLGLSERTLEKWRWLRHGPRFMKVGGRVRYRVVDVEEYEASQLRGPDRAADPFFQGRQ